MKGLIATLLNQILANIKILQGFAFASKVSVNPTAKTTAYTLLVTDGIIEVDTTSATFAITVGAIANDGQVFIFKDVSGNCAVANLTFTASSTTIKGTATIITAYGCTVLIYDKTNNYYLVISKI